jgi:hypothetical protein
VKDLTSAQVAPEQRISFSQGLEQMEAKISYVNDNEKA